MTTKTTYAMFALAAIAALSFSLAPAYADTFPQTVTVSSADDSWNVNDPNACGYGQELRTSLTTYHNQDEVTVVVNATDCSSFSKVVVTIYVNGNYQSFASTTNDYANLNFSNIPINAGDEVEAVAVYHY